MTTYLAVVKYAVDDSDDEKIAALKQGLCDCALRLLEFGVPIGQIQDACEEAFYTVESLA